MKYAMAAYIGLLIAVALTGYAEDPKPRTEVEWCRELAGKYCAEAEVVLWDKSRVDLLNDSESIEVDWCHKWAEAIGQSQWYAIATNRRPAVLLLVTDFEREQKAIYRATAVCQRLGVRLYLEPVK